MTIIELREKRAKLWDTMEGFLDTHRDRKGVLSAEDDAVYANMEKELNDLTNEVRRKFGIPATNLTTKGESIEFSTPTIEGTVLRRNKLDGQGKHPWKAEVSEDSTGVTASVISGWYTEVYVRKDGLQPAPCSDTVW